MSDWIDVNDGLPEIFDCEYICYCQHDNDNVDGLVTSLIYDKQNGWGEEVGNAINWNDFVTHWQPLPEPPAT